MQDVDSPTGSDSVGSAAETQNNATLVIDGETADLETFLKSYSALQRQLRETEDLLADHHTTHGDLQDVVCQLHEAQEELEELRRERQEMAAQLARQGDEHAEKNLCLEAAQGRLEQVMVQLEALSCEKQAMECRARKQASEAEETRMRLQELQSQLLAEKAKVKQHTAHIEELGVQQHALQGQLHGARTQAESLRAEHERVAVEMQQEKEQAAAEISQRRLEEAAQHEAEVARLHESLSLSRASEQMQKAELSALAEANQRLACKCAGLESQLQDAEDQAAQRAASCWPRFKDMVLKVNKRGAGSHKNNKRNLGRMLDVEMLDNPLASSAATADSP